MKFAITREISPSINDCELTHLQRAPIDLGLARKQHNAYCAVLGELGWKVVCLPASPGLADSVFVEDTAVVVEEAAILTNPGAASRRPEVATVAEAIERFRRTMYIQPPATLDGGDVLVLNRDVWVGVGSRTNAQGLESLRGFLQPLGYVVHVAQSCGCLHLKSAVTQAGPGCLMVNPDWIEPRMFTGLEIIEVDPQEPFAANVLWLGDATLVAEAYPRTRARLEGHGLTCRSVDMSELAKAEGALTCCSILFDGRDE